MIEILLRRNLFFASLLAFVLLGKSDSFAQGLSVNSCPAVVKRSNGNGSATSAAGDFTPTYTQNNSVAENVVGTPYQKVAFDPSSKTGNILFSWMAPSAPVNLPVITPVAMESLISGSPPIKMENGQIR